MYEADGYYIKECYDNNKDKHVYIDEDLCCYKFYNAFDHGLKGGWVRGFVEYKKLYSVKDPIVRWGGFEEWVHGGV